MQFRKLNKDELEPLKEEFLKYLLVAGLDPQAWESLKKEDSETAEKHLENFSDLVFTRILEANIFVDIINQDRLELYQFVKDKALVYILENKELGSFNYSNAAWENFDLTKVNCLIGSKSYKEKRELEMFQILQKKGAHLSDGFLFKKLALLLAVN